MDVKEKLIQCIRTLNAVTVSGKDNLNHQLGVILTLEQIVDQLGKEEDHGQDNS